MHAHAFIFHCILKSAHEHYETSKEMGYDALRTRLCKYKPIHGGGGRGAYPAHAHYKSRVHAQIFGNL